LAEQLIPDDVRALYEELIDEGGRIVSGEDWNETVLKLLQCGLATKGARMPPVLRPVGPETAALRLFARWQRAVDETRRAHAAAALAAIRIQRVASRFAIKQASRASCTVVFGKNHAGTLHDSLARTGDRLSREWVTGPYGEPMTLPTGEPHPVDSLYFAPDPEFTARGGESRILSDQARLDDNAADLTAGFSDGEQIRIVRGKLPMKLLLVDDHTALVPLGPYGHPCVLVRDPKLVATFARFFELMWAKGTPWTPGDVQLPIKRDRHRQPILEALAAGLKDEAIARQQGISVRTVRRHITNLMQELGATNRFAAGVAAARRGWVAHPD
jgi:DNA-binding CsgD family transcriptional regulator